MHANRFVPRESEPSLPARSRHVSLGSTPINGGVDFAVHAGHATGVDVCFFEPGNPYSERRYRLRRGMHGVWSGHVPGVGVGQAYGYRVYGRWDPNTGMRHNPAKLLLDPYARALTSQPSLHPALYAHTVDAALHPEPSFPMDDRDSAPFAAVGTVMEDVPNDTEHPRIPWDRTVIYEAHVVGLTKNMTELPEELRGTYAGVANPHTINYLKRLGVTAIELLPIHAKMSEPFLAGKGLENYWGYNTLSYFAPEPSYAMKSNQEAGPHAVLDEVKGMVKLLHAAGIEVILDVVYNHTCEAGADGPTVSWRGLDNTMYYRHDSARPGVLKDVTGCGNTLDFRRRGVMRMALDSLRYWVEIIGVDGFRFDLAVTLGREGDRFNHNHPFYVAMGTDPVLSTVKLINEPWDMGPGGWRTGQFPAPTADWNDRFRDAIRSFWVTEPAALLSGGHGGDQRELATRLSGSADLFSHGRIPGGRGVHAAVNFVTAHDGFTMRDLVTYNQKHNEANLEDNRDGSDNNRSWNHGVEGETDPTDPAVWNARLKSIRNLMATLIFSAGTPMIAAGDEILKTQHGNNNAYCQNTEISWLDWEMTPDKHDMLDTVSYLLRLRHDHTVLRPTAFYTGNPLPGDTIRDLHWYDELGNAMPDYKWFDHHNRLVQMMRSGGGKDVDALLILNGSTQNKVVKLPAGRGTPYTHVWTSEWARPREHSQAYVPGAVTSVAPLSVSLFFADPRPIH